VLGLVYTLQTMAAITGKAWNQDTLTCALTALRSDVAVGPNAPGGRPEYRNSLAASFLFKFYVHVSFCRTRYGGLACCALIPLAACMGCQQHGSYPVCIYLCQCESIVANKRSWGACYPWYNWMIIAGRWHMASCDNMLCICWVWLSAGPAGVP
jgi:hypothetical protein